MKHFAGLAVLLAIAGCTATDPNAASLVGNTDIGANAAPRGSAAFCERYARQTQSNVYGTNRDESSSPDLQARIAADAALERCLAGRTN